MAKYATFGHMAYGIWACHIGHVGCPGARWDVYRWPVKTRPKLQGYFQSYGTNQNVSFRPPITGANLGQKVAKTEVKTKVGKRRRNFLIFAHSTYKHAKTT